MRDVGYVIAVMLGWPIAAALIALMLPVDNGRVFLLAWFLLVIGGWLLTMPRTRQQ
jgi:hypothetical protein